MIIIIDNNYNNNEKTLLCSLMHAHNNILDQVKPTHCVEVRVTDELSFI